MSETLRALMIVDHEDKPKAEFRDLTSCRHMTGAGRHQRHIWRQLWRFRAEPYVLQWLQLAAFVIRPASGLSKRQFGFPKTKRVPSASAPRTRSSQGHTGR